STDDEVQFRNGVELDPHIKDEHGAVPLVHYAPSKQSKKRREQLTKIATDILQKAVRKKSTEVTCPQITTFTCKARCGWVLSLIHHVKLIKWSVFTLQTIALIIIPLVGQIRP